MKVGPLLIAGLAASLIWTAGGCGVVNSLLGHEQSTNQWLQQNQARIFQEQDVPEPEVQPFTHFAAGQLLEGKKQIQQAIIQYRKALDLNPKFTGARNRLAICLDKVGQHTEAERTLRRAIKMDPKLAYLRNNLAFSLMAQKRWSDSERELRAALQLKPDYQRARVNLGIVMSRLARRDEAFQQFQMVLGDARAHYNMGLLDKAGGRYAQAAESFRNAIALEPNLTAAKIQLEKLRTMASIAPQELERQAGHVAPSHSVVATQVPPRQPPSVQTVRVAVQTQHDEEQDAVAAKSPTISLPRESHEQNDAVVETAVAAQAEPDISGMSIGRSEDPVFADEMEDNGADFSWEVADVSATAPRAAGDSPAPVAKVELPAPKTAAEVPTVAAATPRPVQPQLSDPMPTAPAAETPEPTHHEIETSKMLPK
ncbi:MAG: tetratricopeptide repeat protein [Planctomycetes bacterium]|nr:tetratricopeptide repeat protein [Planctomycetota bacterium]